MLTYIHQTILHEVSVVTYLVTMLL